MRQKLPPAISIAAFVVALLGVRGRRSSRPDSTRSSRTTPTMWTASTLSEPPPHGQPVHRASSPTNQAGRLPNDMIAGAPEANLLEGLDSTAFHEIGAKAADSNQLDGLNSTEFLGVHHKAGQRGTAQRLRRDRVPAQSARLRRFVAD
jgi:hypothetical protein